MPLHTTVWDAADPLTDRDRITAHPDAALEDGDPDPIQAVLVDIDRAKGITERSAARRIHITGASGAGVSTLGRALARRTDAVAVDTDDYYWLPTDPPFQAKRPVPERLRLLAAALDAPQGWVLAGSLMGWGDPLIPRFDLVIYIAAPTEIRLARLRIRERRRFGTKIDEGGALQATHQAFLDWAAGYDTGAKGGRSGEGHRAWLATLTCPVLRLDGEATPESLVEQALASATAVSRT